MPATTTPIAAGPGWTAGDVVCTAGPGERPFEEAHEATCVALVTEGSFRYRSSQGEALLAPGALLLGNAGACYECGHEHAAGDRCLSFHFSGDFLERAADGRAGGRRAFASARIAPLAATARLAADAEAARAAGDAEALGEVALRIAAAAAALDGGGGVPRPARAEELRRVTRVVRRVEAEAQEPLRLDDLAEEARLSAHHFLRVFSAVVGMTPYQYLLRTRLARAARLLRTSGETVCAIALDAGFEDLSTFNRRFRSVMGVTPVAWRRGARGG